MPGLESGLPTAAWPCSIVEITVVTMVGRVSVAGFGVSLDGFGAGPEQSLDNPLGKRGGELHGWLLRTRTFKAMFGQTGGSEGVDESFAHRAVDGFGAFIPGRNMFGQVRGEWPDDSWKGWWGDNPPYRAPTFVLTHHARDPIVMKGAPPYTSLRTGFTLRSSAPASWQEPAT